MVDSLKTHAHSFGAKNIEAETRQTQVNSVFNSVASKYDVMNDAMSLGVHRLWKREAIRKLNPKTTEKLWDLAGGTGDMTLRMLAQCPDITHPITLCDISPAMLAEGEKRLTDKGLAQQFRTVAASAEQLPFPDNSFDAGIISFGLRNVTHIDKALAEAWRVTNWGGRFYCLEFSHVALPWLANLYDRFSFDVIPRLGKAIAGDKDSYQYLVESIRAFPKQEILKQTFQDAGFNRVGYQNFSGGIVALHWGWKL